MARGIFSGAGGDENLKSNFIWPNGAVDMQICALLTRSQCKVSDTQVTVKACGPLVIETCPCSRAFGSGAVTT